MITGEDFIPRCGCRSVGECTHGMFADVKAFDEVVKQFGKQMKAKFRRKFMGGRRGWDEKDQRQFLLSSLKRHIEKGDMVDVANLAAMIWNMEQP